MTSLVERLRDVPSPELIRELIRFDGEHYYWNLRPRSMFASDRSFGHWNVEFGNKRTMFGVQSSGYAAITILGKPYPAHRVIWAFHYGEWPSGQIDHINGDKTDNSISNLRVVTNAENARNQKRRHDNKSGVTGVSFRNSDKRWQASITVNGKTRHLGIFREMNDAVSARKAAEKDFGFHENHGRAA